ncbi:hypothetical protein G5B47_02435 [Paenibacillus sp. 7124]|uniref:Uncharacterized protein n=1 Tax=Paenibacillus apii TaxID=1850370 RepID=A0A6M1PDJ3_9BACL|nr:hypothetical protein [Paenibacillus apii]NGM81266.1 hypothetical protein [Paenibacillus apii]
MSLRKFPVTAPDGTEFRVEIEEIDDYFHGRIAQVSLHIPVKRRKFQRMFTKVFRSIVDYDHMEPDYVRMATQTLTEYSDRERKKAEDEARRKAAAKRFAEWDGTL